MAAAEVSHHALFHTLDTAVKDTNFARVAHAADEVLKVLPNDKVRAPRAPSTPLAQNMAAPHA